MKITLNNVTLELLEGDIVDQDTDAVVNAAHWDLLGGQGVDGSIHGCGGPSILAECREIGGCGIGCAVITGGGKLKARYVIHAVGPVYDPGDGSDDHEADLLYCAYENSLKLAVENGLSSISFPSLSTGAFAYPMRRAAPVAMKAITDFMLTNPGTIKLIRFVVYTEEAPKAYEIYSTALADIVSET